MIALLHGRLLDKRPPTILIETAGGVGYEVTVPMSTLYYLPATGEAVRLFTHLISREDDVQLFGFATAAERDAFRLLIRISGVGPRIALALLSHLTVSELKAAVAAQNSQRLVKIPGIGKKTAERLLLELKDRLAQLPWGESAQPAADAARAGDPPSAPPPTAPSEEELPEGAARQQLVRDVVAALTALGYQETQIAGVVSQIPAALLLPDAIKWALRQMVGGSRG